MAPDAATQKAGYAGFPTAPAEADFWQRPNVDVPYAVRFASGGWQQYGEGRPAFTILLQDPAQRDWLRQAGAYSAAMAFIGGELDVEGDLVAAIHHQLAGRASAYQRFLAWLIARLSPLRLESWLQSRSRAAANIRFHYDRSNQFFARFLDSRMVYSCAYFSDIRMSLEQAQLAKLDHICRKLRLRPGERFLDVGCGWGALLFHAAEHYGVHATGCTLSAKQFDYVREAIERRRLSGKVEVHDCDYRQLSGSFHKIASVGMFEHVGRRRLRGYFRTLRSLLHPGGLLLNHGIVRPDLVRDDAQSVFLRRKVFPGGELSSLAAVIRCAGQEGWEVLDVENLRPHYALTCRAWVERLRADAPACLQLVGREAYRTWVLYLAGSAANFESGLTDVYQILFARREDPVRSLSRAYIYRGR